MSPRPVQTYLLGLRLKGSMTSASLHAVLHLFLPYKFPSGSFCVPTGPSMIPSVPLCTTAHPNVPSCWPLNVPLHPFTSNYALLQPILMPLPSVPLDVTACNLTLPACTPVNNLALPTCTPTYNLTLPTCNLTVHACIPIHNLDLPACRMILIG